MLSGGSSISLAKQHSISSRQIRYWTQVFAIHGKRSFAFTAQYGIAKDKIKALHLMWTNSWSLTAH
ncbi:hypothetical protein [Photobacterium angustum]|uniref:hypothetical protein n=1 Tax=Photobacterium angustum TaxID=661 RepID=UPI001E5E0FEB|nr:hypothetical protein [Photobacterium angustum]